jgi:hypothetical protein
MVPDVGKPLGDDTLSKLSDTQIGQLWALREEALKIPEHKS